MFYVIPTALRALVASFLWSNEIHEALTPLRFQLRHEHGVFNESRTIFSDIAPSFAAESYQVSTQHVQSFRPDSFTAFSNARARSMMHMQSEPLDWDDTDVLGPDVSKRETLLQLAKMTYNAYAEPGDKDWYDLGSGWNTVRHHFRTRSAIPSLTPLCRAILLVGNRTQMAFVATYLSQRIIQLS